MIQKFKCQVSLCIDILSEITHCKLKIHYILHGGRAVPFMFFGWHAILTFSFGWAHAWQRQGISQKMNWSALNSISLSASRGGTRTWCALLTWLWTSKTSRHALQVCHHKKSNFSIMNFCFDLCKHVLETHTCHSHPAFYSVVQADRSCYPFLFAWKTWLYSFSLCPSPSMRFLTAWS